MLRLMKAELYKLFKGRAFKTLCVVAVVLGILLVGITSIITEDFLMDSLGDVPQAQKEQMLTDLKSMGSSDSVVVAGQLGYNTNGVKDMFNVTGQEVFHVAFGSGIAEVLIAILVASMMAKEYTQGTIKNTLAYGKRREHFYLAKLLAIAIGVAIILAIMTIIPTIIITIKNGWGGSFEMSQLLNIIGVYLGATVVYSAIAAVIMLLATILKSNGATIGISIGIFVFVPTILGFLYGKLDWFDAIYEKTLFYNSALATSLLATSKDVVTATAIGTITLVIAAICAIVIFKKQDIK